MSKIAVIGSLTIDNVAYTSNVPTPGKTVIGDNFISNVGGKGANQACAIKFLGGDAIFFGAKGKDKNGEVASTALYESGLRFYLKRVDLPTGAANIIINEKSGENMIVCVPGANMSLIKDDVDFWMPKILECDILICQMEVPIDVILYAIKKAKEAGITTILNPAPYSDFDKKMLAYVDYFIPNEHELDDFDKEGFDLMDKAKKALDYGAKNVIVTLGEKGSILINNETSFIVEPYVVDAVDTTCAGDSYIGAFAYYLSLGREVKEAMDFASYCSSLTVTKKGAIISLPHIEDINYSVR